MTRSSGDGLFGTIFASSIFRILLSLVNLASSILLARYFSLDDRGVISGVMTGITVLSSIISSLQIEKILKNESSVSQSLRSMLPWFAILCAICMAWLHLKYELVFRDVLIVGLNFILTYLNALMVNSIFKFQSILIANSVNLIYSVLIFLGINLMVVLHSVDISYYLFYATFVESSIFFSAVLLHRAHLEGNISTRNRVLETSRVAWLAAFLESNSIALLIFIFAIFSSFQTIGLMTVTLSILSPFFLVLTTLAPFVLDSDSTFRNFPTQRGKKSKWLAIVLGVFLSLALVSLYAAFLAKFVERIFGSFYSDLQKSSGLICGLGILMVIDKLSMLFLRRLKKDLTSLSINFGRYTLYLVLGYLSSLLNWSFKAIICSMMVICVISFLLSVLGLKQRARTEGL